MTDLIDIPNEALDEAGYVLAILIGHTVEDFRARKPAPNTREIARRVITAALPALRAQIGAETRAKIAAEIEAKLPRSLVRPGADWDDFIRHECYSKAARIARGETNG